MERQVSHLVRLVDDLLEVSRITRSKIELRQETVDLAGIIDGAVETTRPLIESSAHQLAIAVPPEPITISADPLRLMQVVANLLTNAAKYTERGGQIWLAARREGDEAVISVRDTGFGNSGGNAGARVRYVFAGRPHVEPLARRSGDRADAGEKLRADARRQHRSP